MVRCLRVSLSADCTGLVASLLLHWTSQLWRVPPRICRLTFPSWTSSSGFNCLIYQKTFYIIVVINFSDRGIVIIKAHWFLVLKRVCRTPQMGHILERKAGSIKLCKAVTLPDVLQSTGNKPDFTHPTPISKSISSIRGPHLPQICHRSSRNTSPLVDNIVCAAGKHHSSNNATNKQN